MTGRTFSVATFEYGCPILNYELEIMILIIVRVQFVQTRSIPTVLALQINS